MLSDILLSVSAFLPFSFLVSDAILVLYIRASVAERVELGRWSRVRKPILQLDRLLHCAARHVTHGWEARVTYLSRSLRFEELCEFLIFVTRIMGPNLI